MTDKITEFPKSQPETPNPTTHEMLQGYLDAATAHLQAIAEMSVKIETVVTRDHMVNSAVAEATRAARQRAKESYFWLHQAAAAVGSILEIVEQKENEE